MNRMLIAVGLVAVCLQVGCGSPGPADSGYVDSGTPCTTQENCPKLHCLADGGMAPEDAGNTSTIQACVFGRCMESCK